MLSVRPRSVYCNTRIHTPSSTCINCLVDADFLGLDEVSTLSNSIVLRSRYRTGTLMRINVVIRVYLLFSII